MPNVSTSIRIAHQVVARSQQASKLRRTQKPIALLILLVVGRLQSIRAAYRDFLANTSPANSIDVKKPLIRNLVLYAPRVRHFAALRHLSIRDPIANVGAHSNGVP